MNDIRAGQRASLLARVLLADYRKSLTSWSTGTQARAPWQR
jgi:hypothetical protein